MLILVTLFFAVVGIQLLYLIVFLVAFLRRRKEGDITPVPVSILVCAHDEEANLRELIPLLLTQDHPQFEVIIVNDRSNDGTYDFLLEETKRDTRLRMVNVDRVPNQMNGKKFGITLGVKAALHEWILFTDADCRPAGQQWLARMACHFTDNTKFVLGLSPYQKLPGFLNMFIRFETVLTALQYISYALLGNPYMGVGRNLAYRKSLFLEKKGFNQFMNVTGGDDDLFVNQHARGSDTRVEFLPEAQVVSVPKTTWRAFFRQKIRHLAVGKRYRPGHRILLGVFALTWILTWFTGVALVILDTSLWCMVLAGIVFRILVLMIVVRTFVKRARLPFELWATPFLDFLYSFYYISTGLVALLTKKIQWRN